MKIGILALQGAFIEHSNILEKLGVETFEIRQKKDLIQDIDGLILPGGESTVQSKLLKKLDLFEPIQKLINNGLPVMGTCAGLILLAKNIKNQKDSYLKSLPVTVVRNAYGRQLGSFNTEQELKGIGNIQMTFIRAPYIESVEDNVEILAKVEDKIVAVKYNNQLALSFHPELTQNNTMHKYFLSMIA